MLPTWLFLLWTCSDEIGPWSQTRHQLWDSPQTEPQIQTKTYCDNLLNPKGSQIQSFYFLKLQTEAQFQKHQENSLNKTFLQDRSLKSFSV